MSQIEVSIYDQTAVFTNTPDIFSGGVGTDTVKFTFDDSWSVYDERTAIFYNEPKKSYPTILNNTNIAVIPSEVIDRKTTMYFGVIGTKSNGNVKTSSILSYRIEKGAITADTETPYPSTDVWLQILANYEFALKKVNDMSNHLENSLEEMNNSIDEIDKRVIDSAQENKANINFDNITNDATKVLLSKVTMDTILSGDIVKKYQIQSGTVTVDREAASSGVSVTLPVKYKAAPLVILSGATFESSGKKPIVTSYMDVTAQGFKIFAFQISTIPQQLAQSGTVNWVTLGRVIEITILEQPTDQTVTVGKTAVFKVIASGDGLKYQWQWSADGTTWKNTSTTTASYTVTPSASYNGYKYRCVITDSNGDSITTDIVTLTVIPKNPTINAVAGNKEVALSWSASEGATRYRVFYRPVGCDWVLVGDVTNTTYTVTGLTNGARYEFVVLAGNDTKFATLDASKIVAAKPA